MSKVSIGIDLGTTYSCVGIFRNGKVEIIPNQYGNRTTPSYVAFTDTGILIGDEAKNQVGKNPKNTVFAVKRLIGRKFHDPIIQANMKHWPFQIVNDNGKPMIEVEYKKQRKVFTPEEISSMIVREMKKIAEKYLGKTVSNVLITVPSYFNDSQRQSTIDATHMAGLDVLRLINESTAAAFAYGLDKCESGEKNVLIFDLGGGTFNVSILTIEEGVFEVRSISGDIHLGGEDFDNRMVEYFVRRFRYEHKKDISENTSVLRRLRTACEMAKLTLSLSSEAAIEIDSLYEGIDFRSTIDRERFEELNDDLFRSTIQIVEKTLRDANIGRSNIDEIVLIGGSTRIPRLQQLLENFFGGKKLNKSINPDQAVAYGAAIQIAILTGDIKDLVLLDVVPMSLGIETVDGFMTVLIKHNTTIPTKQTESFSWKSFPRNASEIIIRVFEGEHKKVEHNHFLGSFNFPIDFLTPADEPVINVTFDIDGNSALSVSTSNIINQHEVTTRIRHDQKCSFESDIESMFDEHDSTLAKKKLVSYYLTIKQQLQDDKIKYKIDFNDKKKIFDIIEDIFKWMKTNQHCEEIQIEEKLKEIQQVCAPIMIKLLRDLDNNEESSYVPHGSTMTSPFYNACRNNNIELVEYYLQIMSIEGIDHMEPNGSTALHVASYRGYEKIVTLLLEKGASYSILNKYNKTPLDEAKTDKIKQMIRRRMNTRFISNLLEWIIPTNDADYQADKYKKKLETYGKDPNFHQFIVYIKQNYIEKDLRDVQHIDKIVEYFNEAIKEKNPVYLIQAYTAETGFYSTLNLQLARLRLENLTEENNLGRAYYIGIIAFHPDFETFSYTGQVYRGLIITMDDLKQYKEGTRILTKTFSSTSKDLNVARRFLRTKGDINNRLTTICIYEIRNPRTALAIEHISLFPTEREVLILPYSAFKIIDIQIDKDMLPNVQIKLKECEPW